MARTRHRRSIAVSFWMTHAELMRRDNEGKSFPHKLVNFLSSHLWAWLWSYFSHRFGPKHRFQTYAGIKDDNGIYDFADGETVRISLTGDWGSGTDEADLVSNFMMKVEEAWGKWQASRTKGQLFLSAQRILAHHCPRHRVQLHRRSFAGIDFQTGLQTAETTLGLAARRGETSGRRQARDHFTQPPSILLRLR